MGIYSYSEMSLWFRHSSMLDILGGPILLVGPIRDLQMKACPNPTGAHIFVGRTDDSELRNNIGIPAEVYMWCCPCP